MNITVDVFIYDDACAFLQETLQVSVTNEKQVLLARGMTGKTGANEWVESSSGRLSVAREISMKCS